MLDLFTLAASMGIQSEMDKIRHDVGNAHEDTSAPAEHESTAVSAVSSAIDAVESAVSSVASALVPSASMVSGLCAPVTVDLSLPTTAAAAKC